MPRMFIVPGKLRRSSQDSQEEALVESQSRESESGEMYLTGRTLLIISDACGRILFDTDGTPMLEGEFYWVTSSGISRVA